MPAGRRLEVLDTVREGAPIDFLAGVTADADLLADILAAAPIDDGGRRVLNGWNAKGAHFLGWPRADPLRFSDNAKFDDATFHGDQFGFHRTEFGDRCSFRGARFHADISFQQARFGSIARFDGAEFHRQASFMEAHFGADAKFDDTTFHASAVFSRSTFEDNCAFNRAAFHGQTWLVLTVRSGSVWLPDTVFGDRAYFSGRIDGELRLERARFESGVRARELIVGQQAILNEVVFGARASLSLRCPSVEAHGIHWHAGGQLELADADVSLEDSAFDAPTTLAAAPAGTGHRRPRLLSLRGSDLTNLTISAIELRDCRFHRSHNVSALWIDGTPRFSASTGRFQMNRATLVEERRKDLDIEPALVAETYRALRKGREDAKDEPGAADFHYGEMHMRRKAAARNARGALRKPRRYGPAITWSVEYLILWLYWLLSGYGLRAWRALTALTAVVTVGAAGFVAVGAPNGKYSWGDALRLAAQSTTSLLRAPTKPLAPAGEWIDLALRILGPLLLGLAALAIRARVKR